MIDIIPKFDWKDLDGKKLTINVQRDIDHLAKEVITVVGGMDENGNVYILYAERKKAC
ncbi:hypothetical protein D3C85_580860 [compost metagenome]